MPRPPIQHLKHILSIPDDTKDFLDEMMNKWIAGKAVRAIGHASQGLLGNPLLAGGVIAAILALIAARFGFDIAGAVTKWYGGIQGLLNAETVAEKEEATQNTANGLRDLIKIFSPLGPLTPLP